MSKADELFNRLEASLKRAVAKGPPAGTISMRDMINRLMPIIEELLKQGWSYRAIAQHLKRDENIDIAMGTLQSYVRDYRASNEDIDDDTPRVRKGRRKADAEAQAQQQGQRPVQQAIQQQRQPVQQVRQPVPPPSSGWPAGTPRPTLRVNEDA